jgi:parallel beta-helix repeat protein
MHDNGIGVLSLSTDYSITNNVVDTCGKGVYLKTSGIFVSKNTFYTCSDAAIDVEDAATTILRASYNVIDSCGDGINSANAHGNFPYLDWNNWSNNTADIGANMSVAAKGEHATADAPGFADAPNGDFAPSGLAQLTSATGSLFYQGAVQTSGENGGVQVGYVGS